LLAFWTLTRRVYWRAAYGARVTVQALFAEQLFAAIDPASHRAEEYGCGVQLPAEFDAWFSNCVARSPEHRFADARAAVNALTSVLEEAADADPLAGTPLLARLDSAADLRQSAPVPISSRRSPLSEEMAGTTADVLAGEATAGASVYGAETTSPTGAHGYESTNLQGGPENHPTQMPPAHVASSLRRSTSTGPGRVAVAFAIPAAAIIGAGIAYAVMQDDDTPQAEVRRVDDAPEERPDPNDTEPTPGGAVDLRTLPAPAAVAFLGWTDDSKQFAVSASYGHKLADGDRPANYLALVHVADGLTGEIEASYVVDRVVSASVPAEDPLARAAATAQPSERWMDRRTSLLLRSPEARRAPPRPGELRLRLHDVPGRTRVQTQPKLGGFDVAWWGFRDEAKVDTAPRVELAWNTEAGGTTVLDERFAVGPRQLASVQAAREIVFRTKVRVFWSPDATHCVITFDGETDPPTPDLVDRRWFLSAI
jgi:hypothetical protein